jgi:hypothetical protein
MGKIHNYEPVADDLEAVQNGRLGTGVDGP